MLRGPAGVLAICVLVGGVMLAGSWFFRAAMQSEYRTHHNRFLQVSRKYLTVDEEERIIRTHYPRFVELYNRGIIGAENRLDWIEALREAGERIGIPELRYRIDAQGELQPDFPVTTGAYQIHASPMELDMGLLHEGDFIALLRELDRKARGLYRVQTCSFKRAATKFELDPTRPNISARCELLWLTVNLGSDREIVL